jgi:hypothetical protein
MNQASIQNTGDRAIADTHHGRIDERQRAIVDHGIRMQQSGNTMAAFEYLRGREVHHHVIQRVLLDPRHRRELS